MGCVEFIHDGSRDSSAIGQLVPLAASPITDCLQMLAAVSYSLRPAGRLPSARCLSGVADELGNAIPELLGMLAAFNQYRSKSDGADIRYKMGEKAKRGGTLGRAPLGYKNVRVEYEGRLINTVAVDDDRASFVRIA